MRECWRVILQNAATATGSARCTRKKCIRLKHFYLLIEITALFVVIVVGLMPVLMLSFVTNEAFGFVLNLLTVMCFAGLHEVARELENPFQNVPNDVPLNNFQAQFNEALMTMFSGFHPDAFWQVVMHEETAGKQDGNGPPTEGNGQPLPPPPPPPV